MLEDLFISEELNVRVIDPALAHAIVGQPVATPHNILSTSLDGA
jgi:hypothetical protein